MKKLLVVALVLLAGGRASAQPLTPAQIFARTKATYQSAATYQDQGEVLYQVKNSDPAWYESGDDVYRKPFTTAFVRKTGQFRFSYRDIKRGATGNAFVGWSDGKRFSAWWALTDKISQHRTLAGVLSGMGGGSGTSSERVTDLLLNLDNAAWSLPDLRSVTRLPDMVMAEKTCYHLRGTLQRTPYGASAKSTAPIKGPTESHPGIDVWIDTATFLLIRIAETYNHDTMSHLHMITFYPALNQPVMPADLLFDYDRR